MLTHIDKKGNATIVDISNKKITNRTALASGKIKVAKKTIEIIGKENIKKGDVLTVSKVAGIMAAKNISNLIPMCHPINLENIQIDFSIDNKKSTISVNALAKCNEKTGVEMEALTAVSVCLLTIYDMCKAVDKNMVIEEIYLIEKKGGKTDFKR